MATFKAVILKGNIHVRQDGRTNIKVRITQNREIAYISTDLYVEPGSFLNGHVTKGKDKARINARIIEELNFYQTKYLELGRGASSMSVAAIKNALTKKNESEDIDFYSFAGSVLSKSQDGTLRWYSSAISNLKKFAPVLYTSDIDLKLLNDFEAFLRENGVGNGINNYMRSFRAIFNQAREFYNDEDRGIIRIPQYPFARYKFPKGSAKRSIDSSLTVDELRMLINYAPETKREQVAKDMAMLMFYLIGINTKDLFYLAKPIDGRISYDRFKTGREYSIKLEPEALEIINRYPGKDRLINASENYSDHLNFMKAINIGLHGSGKTIAGIFKKLGIDKHVTTNWFRHTWATIARNDCRINKDDVALCLGHEDSDNRVTDIYIKYDYSIIDESNRKVMDFVIC